MYKRLLIISDTAIYKDKEQIFGFASVVKELEFIEDKFDKIVWIGTNSPELAGNSTLIEVTSKKIQVILIPKMGGKSIFQILKILIFYPYLFLLILKNSINAQIIHTRAPSHPAFVGLLLSFLFPKKIWWHKFAGSWNPVSLPFFYKLQRNVLLKAKHAKVTINGSWPNQALHCHSFENPCLNDVQIAEGELTIAKKTFESPFTFVFIGRLDAAKGVDVIIESLKTIANSSIKKVHFIGDSADKIVFQRQCDFLGNKVEFHGFKASSEVHLILKEADFLLLPSKSEGFPKVIAEAACYGVIPVVSNVGSIAQYINPANGFVWDVNQTQSFGAVLLGAITTSADALQQKAKNVVFLAKLFTFERYRIKLERSIFSTAKKGS